MEHTDHVRLIKKGVKNLGGRWADLGSGTGSFTLALRDVAGAEVEVVSIDKDARALEEQEEHFNRHFPDSHIEFLEKDFTSPLVLENMDGILMANSLHFVPYDRQPALLEKLKASLKPTGTLIVVEYNSDEGNAWVPYPRSADNLKQVLDKVGFSQVEKIGQIASQFLNEIYAIAAQR